MDYMKILFIAALLSLGIALPASAEIAVIVHPDNANTLTKSQVRKIFLGKLKTFPDGTAIQPLDLPAETTTRETFLDKVLRKSEANLNAHWARMLFSSKGKPPKGLSNAAAVKAEVASNAATIAYIDAADIDGSVKVLFTIK